MMSNTAGLGLNPHADYGYQRGLGVEGWGNGLVNCVRKGDNDGQE